MLAQAQLAGARGPRQPGDVEVGGRPNAEPRVMRGPRHAHPSPAAGSHAAVTLALPEAVASMRW